MFALRAVVFALVAVVTLAGADLTLSGLAVRGVQVLPKVPIPQFRRLVDSQGQVVVLGDSVMQFVPPDERGLPSLARLIETESGLRVADLSWPGRPVDVFAAQVAALGRFDLRPQALVLEINLRQFSPPWEARPDLHDPFLVPMLESGWFLPLRAAAVFKHDFGATSVEEFLATPIDAGDDGMATVADLRPRPWFDRASPDDFQLARRRSVATCAFDLQASASLQRLRSLIADAREHDLTTVAFITPLDVELLRRYLSDEELARVERNLDDLFAEIDEPWIEAIDLSTAVGTEGFDHVTAGPDEHLRESGRTIVAQRVAEALQRALGR